MATYSSQSLDAMPGIVSSATWLIDDNNTLVFAEKNNGAWKTYDKPNGTEITTIGGLKPYTGQSTATASGENDVNYISAFDKQAWDNGDLVPDQYRLYRYQDHILQYDPIRNEMRMLKRGDIFAPKFVLPSDGVIDFRTMPDLMALGFDATYYNAITATQITGEVSAVLSPTDGLKVSEIRANYWDYTMQFRHIGAETMSGKTFSVIARAATPTNAMFGLMSLARIPSEAKPQQSYAQLTPCVYFINTTGGRLGNIYLGLDDKATDSVSIALKNSSGAVASLDNMYGKWWRFTASAMGVPNSLMTVTEINPALATSSADLFGDAVKVGATLTAGMPTGRGNMAKYSTFALSLTQSEGGFDVMAVKIA